MCILIVIIMKYNILSIHRKAEGKMHTSGLSMPVGGVGGRQREGSGVQCLMWTILFLNAFDGIPGCPDQHHQWKVGECTR